MLKQKSLGRTGGGINRGENLEDRAQTMSQEQKEHSLFKRQGFSAAC
jgi:hypothetical protein